jgi:glutamate/tyrosine decarboxylase-like PLP-dependent enzyme
LEKALPSHEVSPLNSSEKKVALFSRAANHALEYLAVERASPVHPGAELHEALAPLDDLSLDRPVAPSELLDLLADLGRRTAVRSTGGRYFGFVTGGTEPAALAASVLAQAWDQNAALSTMSPLAHRIDAQVARWLVELLGLPAGATAVLCSGASVANLNAVTVARDHLLRVDGWDVNRNGLMGAPPITVVTSAEAHLSVDKAVRLAGLGTGRIVRAPVDGAGAIDPARLPPIQPPVLMIAQCGNVNTGHSDPVGQIDKVLRTRGLRGRAWIHVDGAFGLWAAASPRYRDQVVGVDRADSWATDGHKWPNSPYDCGVLIMADPGPLVSTMAVDAAYARTPGAGEAGGSAVHWEPMQLGPQMSQRARSIPLLATFATLGRDGMATLIDRCCWLAQHMARRLAAGGADLLAPVVLNQALVAFGDDSVTDAVIAGVEGGGEAWFGPTTWRGRRAMRISVSDVATTLDDADRAVDAVLATWSAVGAGR